MTHDDVNSTTMAERKRIIAGSRGRELAPGIWRNFCSNPSCCMPIVVHAEWLRFKDDLVCDECRPRISKGNALSTAFSSEKRDH